MRQERIMKIVNFVDVRQARIEIKDATINDKTHYFLILAKGNRFDNFIFEHKDSRDRWLAHLHPYCIFGQYELYFKDEEQLGKGSYGLVNATRCIGAEREKFAVKIYEKESLILNSDLIVVSPQEETALRRSEHSKEIGPS